MEDEINNNEEEEGEKIQETIEEVIDADKKWEHLAVRPSTFDEFNILKIQAGCRSADSFVNELLRIYGKRLLGAEYKRRGDKNE